MGTKKDFYSRYEPSIPLPLPRKQNPDTLNIVSDYHRTFLAIVR